MDVILAIRLCYSDYEGFSQALNDSVSIGTKIENYGRRREREMKRGRSERGGDTAAKLPGDR